MTNQISESLTDQAKRRGWTRGTRLSYGEFPATVIRHYHEDMWEVRVPGGEICVAGSQLSPRSVEAIRQACATRRCSSRICACTLAECCRTV